MTWLSVKDVSRELGLGTTAIYGLINSGQLACYRLGPKRGSIRFKPEDVQAYIDSVRIGPKVKVPRPVRHPRAKYDHGF